MRAMELIAQGSFVGSEGFLGGLISLSVLGVLYTVWKFVINARTIEQSMRRRRSTDARAARYEAGLWQGRCADLEYILRQNGIPIPDLSEELRGYVLSRPESTPPLMAMPWDQQAAPGEERNP